MTKIDQIQPGQIGQPQEGRKTSDKAGGDFAKLLDEALGVQGGSTAKVTESTQAFNGVEGVNPTGQVSPPDAPQVLTDLQREGVERAERAITLLEEYADRLGQPGLSLKELQPSLTVLEQEAKGLAQVADRLEPDDELHSIVQEVLMRVAAESVKFNRGDYLTA
jgi:hypothetical protein